MKTAVDFRAIARDALRGRWLSCAGVGLLAVLMGAAIFGLPSVCSFSGGFTCFSGRFCW